MSSSNKYHDGNGSINTINKESSDRYSSNHHSNRSRSRSPTRKKDKRSKRDYSPSSSSSGSNSSDSESSSSDSDRRKKSKKHSRKKHSKKHKHKHKSSKSRSPSNSRDDKSKTKLNKKQKREILQTVNELAAKQSKHEYALLANAMDSNPIIDDNQNNNNVPAFVWKKKIETQLERGVDVSSLPITESQLKSKQLSLKSELESVKQRQQQREIEKAELIALKESMKQITENELDSDWKIKEEEFHRKQSEQRANIRIKQQREKQIDILIKLFQIYNTITDNNNKDDNTEDNNNNSNNNNNSSNTNKSIVDNNNNDGVDSTINLELCTISPLSIVDSFQKVNNTLGYSSNYNSNLSIIINEMQGFRNELQQELVLYSNSVIATANSNNNDLIASQYWKSLLIVTNDEINKLQTQLELILREYENQPTIVRPDPIPLPVKQIIDKLLSNKTLAQLNQLEQQIQTTLTNKNNSNNNTDNEETNLIGNTIDPIYWENILSDLVIYRAKAILNEFHLVLLKYREDNIIKDNSSDSEIREEIKKIEFNDEEQDESNNNNKVNTVVDKILAKIAGPAGSDEEKFAEEYKLVSGIHYSWNDKYRPRKPRYFNRVKTGFDWNKYNRTHYDKDNPPPKIVQGYKFNIFYNDLIDNTKAPYYKIEPSPDNNADFCIIRFISGAPYQDLAFKIVNKDWDRSHKRGFKCVFDRGILQLYFNFKRYFYRR